MNVFENAIRKGFRFHTAVVGGLTTEQLFSLPLQSIKSSSLNSVAKLLSKELREAGEEDFVGTGNNNARRELQDKLDVVKAVIAIKKEALADAAEATRRSAMRQKLLGLKADKEHTALADLSVEEIDKRLSEL